MKHTKYALIAAVLASVALAGCTFRSVSIGYHDDGPRHHDVYVDHVCTYDCDDHYWNGHRIVTLRSGHRHHAGCGHAWEGRHWVVAHDDVHHDQHDVVISKARAGRGHRSSSHARRVTHVHSATCGCAWDRHGRVWASVGHGHVHGHDCGHVYTHGRWSLHR